MKYFFDTEFIEGFKKPFPWLPTIGQFNRPYHSIQLISIGIVAEDGREYYAISSEFNPADANPWVKENVIKKLGWLPIRETNKRIAQDIRNFCEPIGYKNISIPSEIPPSLQLAVAKEQFDNPEFYAYYADYDWVVFCALFGTMMNLPKGFPMYCKDLKQTLDGKAKSSGFTVEYLKKQHDYPTQENEHNALDDAKWNYQLYKFLKSL